MPTVSEGGWLDLSGRVALVTGAASGIGRAAAIALGGASATVVALDRDIAGAESVAAAITAGGGSAQARVLDVTDAAQWDATAAWVQEKWGHLDILVNSAGIVLEDRVGDPLDVHTRTFAINVEGSLLGMKTALAFMKRQGKGAIVNMSSVASIRGAPIMAAYGASKAAITHYSRSGALEMARAGYDIRINSVHPGLIQTSMADDFYSIYSKVGGPEDVVAAMTSGRAGRPEEVADLILFLCSDRASFISGAEIVIDRAQSA